MSNLHAPEKPLPRKYLQSILYLADRMSEADGKVVPRERIMIESLAEAAHMKDFRNDNDYRRLSEFKACGMLDIEEAKAAALVVITLVMKADHINRDGELSFFSKIRGMLKCEPISVPADLQAHKELALKFLG